MKEIVMIEKGGKYEPAMELETAKKRSKKPMSPVVKGIIGTALAASMFFTGLACGDDGKDEPTGSGWNLTETDTIGTVKVYVDSSAVLPTLNATGDIIDNIAKKYTDEIVGNPAAEAKFDGLGAICVVPGNFVPYKDGSNRLIIGDQTPGAQVFTWINDNIIAKLQQKTDIQIAELDNAYWSAKVANYKMLDAKMNAKQA